MAIKKHIQLSDHFSYGTLLRFTLIENIYHKYVCNYNVLTHGKRSVMM